MEKPSTIVILRRKTLPHKYQSLNSRTNSLEVVRCSKSKHLIKSISRWLNRCNLGTTYYLLVVSFDLEARFISKLFVCRLDWWHLWSKFLSDRVSHIPDTHAFQLSTVRWTSLHRPVTTMAEWLISVCMKVWLSFSRMWSSLQL